MNCQHLSLKSGQRPPAPSGPSQEDEWETKYSFDALCLSRERQIRVKTSPILTPVSSFVDKCQSLVFIFSRIRYDVKQLNPYNLYWALYKKSNRENSINQGSPCFRALRRLQWLWKLTNVTNEHWIDVNFQKILTQVFSSSSQQWSLWPLLRPPDDEM